MSEIDFLGNKKADRQEAEAGQGAEKKADIIWSEPKKDKIARSGGLFSFFSSAGKKPGAAVRPDKNKIKESRREILKLIKQRENSEFKTAGGGSRGKNFLSAWKEKLSKQKSHKEILIDYQKIFNQEKIKRGTFSGSAGAAAQPAPLGAPKAAPGPSEVKRTGPATDERPAENFNARPVIKQTEKISSALPTAKNGRPTAWLKLIGLKISSILKPGRESTVMSGVGAKKIVSGLKPDPAGAAENVAGERQEAPVLETNLIKGEIITYFDWRQKIIATMFAVLIPVFLTGAIYAGVSFYQKANREKNLAQIKKYNELAEKVRQEEVDLKKITDFQSSIKKISQIFNGHIYWTNFFKFLEDYTIKDVYYTGFSGDTGGEYTLSAIATSYSNISEQANILKSHKLVTEVETTGGEMTSDDAKNTTVKTSFKFSILKKLFTE